MRTGSRTRFLIVRIEDWVEFTRRRQLSLSSSQVAKLPSCQAVKRARKAYGRDWFFFHALHLFHSNNSQPVKQTPTKRRKIALNASIVRLLRSLLSCSPALSQILVKLKKLMARLKNKGRCWLLFAGAGVSCYLHAIMPTLEPAKAELCGRSADAIQASDEISTAW